MPDKLRTVREIAYQMHEVPIDNGTQEGDVFFVSDNTILGNEFEIIATRPIEIPLPGDKMETASMILVTFRGVVNKDGTLASFTVMMPCSMVRALFAGLKQKFMAIPVEYRS